MSDFTNNGNDKLVQRISDRYSHGKYKLVYIPSKSDATKGYYTQAKQKLKYYGNFECTYCDIDKNFDISKVERTLDSDVIYLSGGNTFNFLYNMKRRKIVDKLRDYALNGGTIIGVSAGAIILTENIEIANYGDENICNLQDLEGLGLVDFSFFPHWNVDYIYLSQLKDYSKKSGKDIYVCNDGDGIIVEDEKVEMYGDIKIIK